MRATQLLLSISVPILLAACDTNLAAPSKSHAIRFRAGSTVSAYFGARRTLADTAYLEVYAAALHGMNEPPLRGATLEHGSRVLRFLWLRSFHPAIAVRVMVSSAGCSVVTTVRTADGFTLGPPDSTGGGTILGPFPGATLRRDSSEVMIAACAALTAHTEAVGITTDQPHTAGGGPDGVLWMLERVDERGHGCLEAWSLDSNSARTIWDAGMAFLTAGHARPKDPHEFQ